MTAQNNLIDVVGQTDIYLLDQIMKGRYQCGERVLDCGCGSGRNLFWFAANDFEVYATDLNAHAIENTRINFPSISAERILVASTEQLPFSDGFFDHVLSSAVLHFASGLKMFQNMFAEQMRVLKPGGIFFLRMTSDTGMKDKMTLIDDGVYSLPDGTQRFILTKEILAAEMISHHLTFAEPFKAVNVADQRAMCVAILRKQ